MTLDETKWVVTRQLDPQFGGLSHQDCTDRELFVVIQRMISEGDFDKIIIEPVANYA